MSEARHSRSDDRYSNSDVICLGRLLGRVVMDVPLRATRSSVSLCEPPRNPLRGKLSYTHVPASSTGKD